MSAAEIPSLIANVRAAFEKASPLPLSWRKQQLLQLKKLCQENSKEICEAISKDLGSVPEIVKVGEVGPTIQEIDLALSQIDEWVKPEPKSVPIVVRPAKGYIHKEAYGVVLIISPWNYPFRLLMFPLIGAIAAGNAVVLKPSEVSANCSAVIKKLADRYLDPNLILTIEGGIETSRAILEQKFDYIMYTGNTEVGRVVMKAAAENLTPVTLELGGKSPVYIDKSCNLDVTTNRLLLGKLGNAGQTCVAPDYVLVDKRIKEQLVDMLKEKLKSWYGEDPFKSESLSRIINERHTARLQGYLDEVRNNIVVGGRSNIAAHYIEPTLVDEPSLNTKIMQEEIFGPILPILGVQSADEAIRFINSRPKPLALYVFSSDQKVTDHVINHTSSGGVGVNGTVFHITCPEIGFGGVGPSGMGQYNGKHTFETFTHRRGVMAKATWIDPKLLYPPLTPQKRAVMDKVAEGVKLPTGLIFGAAAVAAGGAMVALSRL